MKKLLKFLVYFLALIFIIIFYFYQKPALQIEEYPVEKNISIKIFPYFPDDNKNRDSVFVYIPLKIKISNNRLNKIWFGNFYFNDNYRRNFDERDLKFDSNGYLLAGKSDNLEELLYSKKYFKYMQLYYNRDIFPFTSKVFYIYKAVLVNKLSIGIPLGYESDTTLVRNFLYHQKNNLYNKSYFTVNDKIIDSLYLTQNKMKLTLSFDVRNDSRYLDRYRLLYKFENKSQKIIDFSKMTKEELKEYYYSASLKNNCL